MRPKVKAPKTAGEQAGSQAVCPLVEVAKHNAGTVKLVPVQDIRAEQLSDLFPPFKKTRPQVDIENVQCVFRQLYIDPQAATLLASRCADVVILDGTERKTAEQQVAVCATVQAAVFT
jgi:hypothetical protein